MEATLSSRFAQFATLETALTSPTSAVTTLVTGLISHPTPLIT